MVYAQKKQSALDSESPPVTASNAEQMSDTPHEHQIHRDPGRDLSAVAGDPLSEDFIDWGDIEAPGAYFHSFSAADLEMALREHEMDLEGTSGDPPELGDTKAVDLQEPGTGTPRKELGTPSITAQDFEEGTERDAFIMIQEFYRVLLNADSKVSSRLKALEFFFCPRSPFRINLDEAASAIDGEIRSDVFRLRLMFEFWKRWTLFGGPLPEDALPPPSRILTQASFHGEEAVALVSEAWFNPGIQTGELLSLVESDEELTRKQKEKLPSVLKTLFANYILSEKHNSVYCTGKNPILETQDTMLRSGRLSGARKANISWARLF